MLILEPIFGIAVWIGETTPDALQYAILPLLDQVDYFRLLAFGYRREPEQTVVVWSTFAMAYFNHG